MTERRILLRFAELLAIISGFVSMQVLAATPSFTISASNATMPVSGSGSVAWTVASVNGYSGTFSVICSATNPPAGAILPICGGSPIAQVYTLAANGVTQGTIPLSATFCSASGPCPTRLERRRKGVASGLALAGALLVGLGFRRHKARWFVLMLLALSTLASMAGITACSSSNTLTPGVWQYTVSAFDASTTVSTTTNVTVPPGIPVSYY
jgi:hypothetical protein